MDYSLPGSSIHGSLQQEYWSGLPFPSPRDLPNPGIEPRSSALQVYFFFFLLLIIFLKIYPEPSSLLPPQGKGRFRISRYILYHLSHHRYLRVNKDFNPNIKSWQNKQNRLLLFNLPMEMVIDLLNIIICQDKEIEENKW